MITGLAGERVLLAPLDTAQHLENALIWFNDPEVTRYLALPVPPIPTRLSEQEYFEEMQKSKIDVMWAILDEKRTHIGFTGLHKIDWQRRAARTGIVIGWKWYWGKGYATDAMRVRTRYAFETLGLHRLESWCFAENTASAKALQKVGYKIEGRSRKCVFREGKWHDCFMLGMLDDDYFENLHWGYPETL